jgi:hypothetical protein
MPVAAERSPDADSPDDLCSRRAFVAGAVHARSRQGWASWAWVTFVVVFNEIVHGAAGIRWQAGYQRRRGSPLPIGVDANPGLAGGASASPIA